MASGLPWLLDPLPPTQIEPVLTSACHTPGMWHPPVEEIEIAVRVLHKVSADLVPAQPSFERDIRPLFSYHDRYYPWLHVREVAGMYVRFLDINNYDSLSDHVVEVIRRLEMEDHELQKMPRSRDFPIGGLEVIKKWHSSGMLE